LFELLNPATATPFVSIMLYLLNQLS